MRKQLPIIQELEQQRNHYFNTYTSEFGGIHKNVYIDTYPDDEDRDRKVYMVKRPGLVTDTSQFNPSPSPAGSSPLCMAASLSSDGLTNFFVIYSDGTLAGTTFYYSNVLKAKPGTWTGTGNPSHDLLQLPGNSALYGNFYWIFTNYKEGGLVDSTGAVTQIVDVNYTAWLTKTNMVAMDGYIFQADYLTSYIYNSNLNVPGTWTATGRIQANLYPGLVLKLARVRNYLVAFKSTSIEFFENTGQPTPGSPLSAVPQLARRYGCGRGELFVEASDGIIWAGFDPSGRAGIFKLSYDTLAVTEISNAAICAILQGLDKTGAPFLNSIPYGSNTRANALTFRNKELILFPLLINNGTQYSTFVYDNALKNWSMWTMANDAFGGAGSEDRFPCNVIIKRPSASGQTPRTFIFNNSTFACAAFDERTGSDYTFGFETKMVTSFLDFGTTRRKYLNSLSLIVEVSDMSHDIVNSPTFNMTYYNGDEYPATASTVRTFVLDSFKRLYSQQVVFRRLGTFRARRFVIQAKNTGPWRMGAIEVDINMAEDAIT